MLDLRLRPALSAVLAVSLLMSGCLVREEAPTRNDRRVLVRARTVARFLDGVELAHGSSTLAKKRIAGGSLKLSYLYDDPVTGVTINSSLTVLSRGRSARDLYDASLRDLPARARAGVEELEHGIRWGEEARLFLVRSADAPAGNTFTAYDSNLAYTLDLAGVYFDDPALFRRFLRVKLRRLRRYEEGAL